MEPLEFPQWHECLGQADLPSRLKHTFEITIRWYLSFCRRGRAEVTIQSARDFMEWAIQQKQPESWQVGQWKEAINWFFRTGKEERQASAQPEEQVWLPESRAGWPEWKVAFLTTVRRRKYAYRTEQSYLVWIETAAKPT